MSRLSPGDRFPDLQLLSSDGPVELRERWKQGPLVVAFMRHFGWPSCREHLAQLGKAHDEIRAAGGEVVAVFQYRAEPTRHFCRQRGAPFDCFGDPERKAYDAVGLEHGKPLDLIGPKAAVGWIKAAAHGNFAGNPQGGDVTQMPGTFVVAPDGTVAFAHYNRDTADNPSNEDVLEAVRAAAAQAEPTRG